MRRESTATMVTGSERHGSLRFIHHFRSTSFAPHLIHREGPEWSQLDSPMI